MKRAALLVMILACSCSDSSGTLKPGQVSTGGGSNGGNTTGGGTDPGATSDGSAAQTCVDAINMYRATIGAPPYTRWNAEESCADGEAKSDSMSGAAHGAFGMCNELAQDECPGWPGATQSDAITGCLKAMWQAGPGEPHHDTMASTKYTQVACGFYTTSDGKVWSVQNFK
jgi:hypothetical protein